MGVSEDKLLNSITLGDGLHAFDTRDKKCNSSETEFLSCSIVQKAVENKLKLTPNEMRLAEEARTLKTRISSVFTEDFSVALGTNCILNFPFTTKDVRRSARVIGK